MRPSTTALHGFTYRRLYLTTDAALSERFKARFRLEASGTNAVGSKPAPFVKDLWIDMELRRRSLRQIRRHAASGVSVIGACLGDIAVWRRPFSICRGQFVPRFRNRFDGPLPIGNGLRSLRGDAGQRERNWDNTDDKHKKGYARISIHPSEKLFSAGADYERYLHQNSTGGLELLRSPRIAKRGRPCSEGTRETPPVRRQLFFIR